MYLQETAFQPSGSLYVWKTLSNTPVSRSSSSDDRFSSPAPFSPRCRLIDSLYCALAD